MKELKMYTCTCICWLSDYYRLFHYFNPVIRGAPQSDHHITTSFGPFSLPTYGLLRKGRDHSTFGVRCLNYELYYLDTNIHIEL